jgi:hypothetical protein
MFHVMMRPAKPTPKKKKLQKLTSPKYSGVQNRYFAPYIVAVVSVMKLPNKTQIAVNNR